MHVDKKRLPSAIEAARASMQANKVPGLAMAFLSGGETVAFETLGFADATENMPVTERTHFEAASLTKPAFAYVVHRLADAGVLKLDVPLCQYLAAGVPTLDARFAAATAQHVLCHATGLPNWGEHPLPLAFAPGEGFCYSGTGYAFLQAVVEHLTGRRLDELMQTELFNPLGMADAAMVWTGPLNRTLARTVDAAGMPEPVRTSARHQSGMEPNAAYSLYVTLQDYPKFLQHILSEDGFAKRVRAVKNPAGHDVDWGLGWGLYGDLLWHWGDNGGFKSFVCLDPNTRDAFVFHTNGANGLLVCFDVASHCTGFDFSNIAAMVGAAE